MLPSASELKYFLEVAVTLNVSRAAERLGITQPTLSLAIRRLEESLGTPLLIREKTGVTLTRAGTRLASRARRLMDDWQTVRDEARRAESEVGGNYVLGAHPSVALYALPGLTGELLAAHPSLELRLVHDLSRRITDGVISFKIDFGIVVNPVAHPDLVIKQICTDEVTLFRSANCRNDDTLIYDPELVQAQTLVRKLSKKGPLFKRTLSSASLEVVAALTASGAGQGILPSRVARNMGTKLTRVSPLKFDDQICLAYRADAQSSPAARELARALERGLRKALA